MKEFKVEEVTSDASKVCRTEMHFLELLLTKIIRTEVFFWLVPHITHI